MKLLAFFTGIVLLISSCSQSENDDYCSNPPPRMYFELIDQKTGVNVLSQYSFIKDSLQFLNLGGSEPIKFEFVEDYDLNLLNFYTMGFRTDTIYYRIKTRNFFLFDIYAITERKLINDCIETVYHKLNFIHNEVIYNSNYDIYKVNINADSLLSSMYMQ